MENGKAITSNYHFEFIMKQLDRNLDLNENGIININGNSSSFALEENCLKN